MKRHSVKLILLDPDDRMLLANGVDPATGLSHWYPVGGGVEAGETVHAAAAREAWEETGLTQLPDSTHVWSGDAVYEYAGKTVEVHEDWLLVRTSHFEPEATQLSEFEQTSLQGFRWWTASDLESTNASVYPPDLGVRLTRLLSDGPPDAPTDVSR
ncbi:NUDIX domain-containing protein [Luteococcus sp.]|uniref:NUDIX domain-containing protein n=1 Tax=Luteococcus sp. TaxID=1969402 RepID=UPI003735B4B1